MGLDGTSRSNNSKAFSSPYSSYCLMLWKFSSKGEFRLKLGQPSVCALQHSVCLDTFVASSLPNWTPVVTSEFALRNFPKATLKQCPLPWRVSDLWDSGFLWKGTILALSGLGFPWVGSGVAEGRGWNQPL